MTFGKNAALFLLGISVLLTANACGDSDGGDDSPGTDPVDTLDSESGNGSDSDTGVYIPPTASCDYSTSAGGMIYLTDNTNYTFDSTIAVADVTVKSPADLVFDWSGVTVDYFGKSLNPALDINMVLVGLFNMTHDVLADNIRKDNLPLSENKGGIAFYPPAGQPFTWQNLYNFTAPDGSVLPPEERDKRFNVTRPEYQFPQDQYTFMLVAASGTMVGKNSRMFGFFHLDADAPGTSVMLNNDSMKLTYKTNLAQIMPVPVQGGTGALSTTWEYMQRNALDNEFVHTQITKVMIGHYVGMTRPQLDAQFLDLENIATEKWSGEVEFGITMDLSTLTNELTGAPFTGVDNNGVWIMALFCTKGCNIPAPWSISILQPC